MIVSLVHAAVLNAKKTRKQKRIHFIAMASVLVLRGTSIDNNFPLRVFCAELLSSLGLSI